MEYFTIKNWKEFQHYKDRNPPWIKLHNSLTSDYEFNKLTDTQKWHLIAIWLLASRSTKNDGNGSPLLPCDEQYLTRATGSSSRISLKPLISSGFLLCSGVLADCKREAYSSTEAEAYKSTEPEKILYAEIIEDLNLVLGTNYKDNSTETRKLIRARWNEGFRFDDFKRVHRKMYAAWNNDRKMAQFLRPSTLYTGKFDGYLNRKDEAVLSTAGMKAAAAVDEALGVDDA